METRSRTTAGPASVSNPAATPIGPGAPESVEKPPFGESAPETSESSLREKAAEAGEKTGERLREARRNVKERLSRSGEFIREHPTQAAFTGMGVGFLLAQLPLRYFAAGVMRLVLAALKPLLLICGAIKLAEEFQSARPGEKKG